MDRYYALVSTNSTEGQHKRVSADAETLEAAKALFAAKYGAANVVSVWGEREATLPRNDLAIPIAVEAARSLHYPVMSLGCNSTGLGHVLSASDP